MNRLLLVAFIGLLFARVCVADDAKQHRTYSVESIELLTLKELWALGEVQRIEVGDLVVLTQKYDSEYGFARRDMKYCIVFMLGSMDLGARPLGFRVLTKEACSGVRVSKGIDAGSRAFSIDLGAAGTVQVQVTSENSVRIDGSKRGTLPR